MFQLFLKSFVIALILFSCGQSKRTRFPGKENGLGRVNIEGDNLKELEDRLEKSVIEESYKPKVSESTVYDYSLIKSELRSFKVGEVDCQFSVTQVRVEEKVTSLSEDGLSFVVNVNSSPVDPIYVGFGTGKVKEICEKNSSLFLQKKDEGLHKAFYELDNANRLKIKERLAFLKRACERGDRFQHGECLSLSITVDKNVYNTEFRKIPFYLITVQLNGEEGSLSFDWSVQLETPFLSSLGMLSVGGTVPIFEDRPSLFTYNSFSIFDWKMTTLSD